MSFRKSMTRSQSNGNFRRAAHVHPRNMARAMRGGYRI